MKKTEVGVNESSVDQLIDDINDFSNILKKLTHDKLERENLQPKTLYILYTKNEGIKIKWDLKDEVDPPVESIFQKYDKLIIVDNEGEMRYSNFQILKGLMNDWVEPPLTNLCELTTVDGKILHHSTLDYSTTDYTGFPIHEVVKIGNEYYFRLW